MSSDGDAIVLREVEQSLKLFARLPQCFTDYRNPNRCEHRVSELLAQRILSSALGYEDLNDHDQLPKSEIQIEAVHIYNYTMLFHNAER